MRCTGHLVSIKKAAIAAFSFAARTTLCPAGRGPCRTGPDFTSAAAACPAVRQRRSTYRSLLVREEHRRVVRVLLGLLGGPFLFRGHQRLLLAFPVAVLSFAQDRSPGEHRRIRVPLQYRLINGPKPLPGKYNGGIDRADDWVGVDRRGERLRDGSGDEGRRARTSGEPRAGAGEPGER